MSRVMKVKLYKELLITLSGTPKVLSTTCISLTKHNEFYCRIYICTDELHLLFFVLQAVDVVGQAGKPKTITGFQTHTTPVLLAYGERAELATEECILTHISTC